MKPGQGKIASLVVPVFLAPGETPDEMLTSSGYEALAKVLGALRAHDAETIEALTDPRHRSGSYHPEGDEQGGETGAEADGQEHADEGEGGPSGPARELLKFSTPRDPAQLARFMRLRVIEPENTFWRRGIEAAVQYLKETGEEQLRVPQNFVTPQDWSPAGFPLGTWLADQRRFHKAGHLDPERAGQLDELGMVWSHQDVALEEGLTAAREWAEAHGRFLPPAPAVWKGYPVGVWAKNQRTAARLADTITKRREAGLPVESTAGALAQARRELLEEVDPGWCPAWDIGWQRCFRLTQMHLQAGGTLPAAAGEVVVQGEDLGRWVSACRLGWENLVPAQRWLLENILRVGPTAAGERPVKRTQEDKWALNLRAAKQYHPREGHLNVPRKHVEHLDTEEAEHDPQGGPREPMAVKLGMVLDNARKRANKLPQQRRADLDALGMRWGPGRVRAAS